MLKLAFLVSMGIAVLAALYGFTGDARWGTAVALVAFVAGVGFGLGFFFKGLKRRQERPRDRPR